MTLYTAAAAALSWRATYCLNNGPTCVTQKVFKRTTCNSSVFCSYIVLVVSLYSLCMFCFNAVLSGGMIVYRHSQSKTVQWLRKKVNHHTDFVVYNTTCAVVKLF